jgi:hypothetical protein
MTWFATLHYLINFNKNETLEKQPLVSLRGVGESKPRARRAGDRRERGNRHIYR